MRGDWIECKFDDVFFTTSGGTPSRRNENYYIGNIPWIKSGELKSNVITEAEEFISEEAVKNSSAKVFPAGTILLALYGATIGKIAILGIPAATNQAICGIFETPFVFSKYAYYYLVNKKSYLIKQGIGGAQPNISQTILKNLDFSLPPLPEQRAIVKKLESLFSSLDAGVADLKKAQQQLKIYRQAVLKKAFEGNDSWSYKIIKDVIKTIDGDRGKNYPKKNEFFQEEYCLFLSTKNVRNGKFLFEDNLFITKDKDSELRSGKLERGDIVLTTRGTLGNVALFDDEIRFENIRINSGMLILRIKDHKELNQKYLMNFINSPIFFDQLKSKQSGTAQPQIPANILKEIIISFPQDIEEQKDIVKQIESRLSVCDSIEQNIKESLEKAEALRQSILKKAFEGNLLTAQELAKCKLADDYEPASVLLERIKAEQTEIKAKPSKKKPRHSVAKSQ